MKLKLRNRDVVVRWHYVKRVDKWMHEGKEMKETVYEGPTECVVSFMSGKDVIDEHSAIVDLDKTHGDRFSKSGGRKWSLKKVIGKMKDTLDLNKEERRAFWNAYRDMRHGSFI